MNRAVATRARGFTLLELLIALGVTTLVLALLFSGFGLIGRTEDRNQARIERAERMFVVSQWLGRKLDGLRPLARVDAGVVSGFFSGNPAGALWIAPLPERGEGGGLHVLRVGPLRHPDGRVDLLVEALPYDGARMQLDWTQALRQVLLADARSLQWHYQDGRGGAWVRQWDAAQGRYPVRVKIELGDAQGDWPPLVFSLPGAR